MMLAEHGLNDSGVSRTSSYLFRARADGSLDTRSSTKGLTLCNLNGYEYPRVTCQSPLSLLGEQLNVYFTEVENEGEKTRYVPRSVQVDLEAGVCNHVRVLVVASSVTLTHRNFEIAQEREAGHSLPTFNICDGRDRSGEQLGERL